MNVIMACQARRLKHDDYHLQDVYQNPKGHGMNEKQYNWRNLACRQSMTVLVRSFVCTKNEKKTTVNSTTQVRNLYAEGEKSWKSCMQT